MSKYHNRKTTYQGIQFASQREAKRYQELELLERAGLIRNLERQPRYNLVVNGYNCGFYKGDFRYVEAETGKSITEDAKGFRTPMYRLKKKLVKALYGVEIVEV